MTDLEVKNCPFCGGVAQYDVNEHGVCIMCRICRCQTTRAVDSKRMNDNRTAVYAVTDFWNRRVKNDEG